MGSSAIDTLLGLSEESWIEIVLGLRFHAELRLRKYTWNSCRRGLPRGWTADDVVLEAITSVLDGTRTIDLDGHSPLEALCGVVNSKLSALVLLAEHRTMEHAEDDGRIAERSVSGDHADGGGTATERSLDALLSEIRTGMVPELLPVFEDIIDGYRPAEIAIRLGRPVETVYVLARRVRKHVAQVIQRGDD